MRLAPAAFGDIEIDVVDRQVGQRAAVVDGLERVHLSAREPGMNGEVGHHACVDGAAHLARHRHFPRDARSVQGRLHAGAEFAPLFEGEAQGALFPRPATGGPDPCERQVAQRFAVALATLLGRQDDIAGPAHEFLLQRPREGRDERDLHPGKLGMEALQHRR
ncbi:hypothetical protein RB2654_08482 [Rhodobacterales bacterium HTCC2654]|uniref:Uncharacterized protein n=1 Tax=Maritimibacter alkaliphilus HTCC2654 TaxID=314271 RepID=A3VHN7_9RHOB|nr:hypothetical protein RB2654_08482 [Rhodobacterales bacterium HTCC2654] [Maritimibacter alkaliphilus HTCC2654]